MDEPADRIFICNDIPDHKSQRVIPHLNLAGDDDFLAFLQREFRGVLHPNRLEKRGLRFCFSSDVLGFGEFEASGGFRFNQAMQCDCLTGIGPGFASNVLRATSLGAC